MPDTPLPPTQLCSWRMVSMTTIVSDTKARGVILAWIRSVQDLEIALVQRPAAGGTTRSFRSPVPQRKNDSARVTRNLERNVRLRARAPLGGEKE